MNKLFTLILGGAFLLTALTSSAQVQRVGLCEEATQASCPPCATLNPGLQTLMNNNSDKVLFLGYQVWWPGFDQMYLDNTADIDARVGDYYGYEFAPQVKFNGTYPNGGDGAVGSLTQTVINNNNAELSEFDIVVDAEVVNGELIVTGSVDGLIDATGDFKLHLVLTEGTIYYDQAPGGTNGETEYHHVMKKFLPGVAGIDLEDSWAVGDSYTIDATYPMAGLTIYNWDDLEVFAFVQNNDNKFIHHAVKDSDISIVVDVANNGTAGEISGTPSVLCSGTQTLTPNFTLINGGNDLLTSADIVYSANGGATQTYSWTGSLETFANEVVTVDPITFEASESDASILEFTVEMPNGMADELSTDDVSTLSIDPAPNTQTIVTVTISTDIYGDETYWEIRSGAGDIIETGGNPNVGLTNIGLGVFPPPFDAASYGNSQTYEIEVVLPTGVDCYTFHITDYYGDGILGGGGYSVTDNLGNEMHNDDDDFTIEAMKNFGGEGATSLVEQTLDNAINIYPNPSSDVLNVSYNIETSEIITFDLINALGAKVATRTVTSSGANTITFDVTNLESGVYQLNTIAGNAFGSTTVTIVR